MTRHLPGQRLGQTRIALRQRFAFSPFKLPVIAIAGIAAFQPGALLVENPQSGKARLHAFKQRAASQPQQQNTLPRSQRHRHRPDRTERHAHFASLGQQAEFAQPDRAGAGGHQMARQAAILRAFRKRAISLPDTGIQALNGQANPPFGIEQEDRIVLTARAQNAQQQGLRIGLQYRIAGQQARAAHSRSQFVGNLFAGELQLHLHAGASGLLNRAVLMPEKKRKQPKQEQEQEEAANGREQVFRVHGLVSR